MNISTATPENPKGIIWVRGVYNKRINEPNLTMKFPFCWSEVERQSAIKKLNENNS